MPAGRPRSVSDEAVFRAVAAAVTEAGPAALTLASVGSRVGLSAPALAQRFGSKRALLVAFSRWAAASAGDAFGTGRHAERDPLARLHAGLAALAEPVATREALANNLALLHLDLTDPELRTSAVAHARAVRARIRSLLARAVAAGQLAPGTDVTVLAETVHTAYNGALVTWAIDGRGSLRAWLRRRIDDVLEPHRRPAGAREGSRTPTPEGTGS